MARSRRSAGRCSDYPLLDAKPSRERDMVLAMIAAWVRDLQSKLATSRSRNTCRRREANATKQIFEIDATPNAKQRQALDRINAIRL